jgi:hypothetical protein
VLVLSIHVHHRQGKPPTSTLSSRLERSVGEGPAVSLSGTAKGPCVNYLWVPFLDQRKLQVPPLRYPGFPAAPGGVGDLHAAFLTESRTRGRWLVPLSRKSRYAPVGMTKFGAAAYLGGGGDGWTESRALDRLATSSYGVMLETDSAEAQKVSFTAPWNTRAPYEVSVDVIWPNVAETNDELDPRLPLLPGAAKAG